MRNLLSVNVRRNFLGNEFITINKNQETKWDEIKHIVISLINDYYASDKNFVVDKNLKEQNEDLEEIEKRL